jgi:hypothetical protein
MNLNQEIKDSDINDIIINRIEDISKLTNIDGAGPILKKFHEEKPI